MKRRTGKKIGKIVLLVILAAMVGVIVYTALTWPVYPDRQKPAESYQQMKQTAEDLGVLAPPAASGSTRRSTWPLSASPSG